MENNIYTSDEPSPSSISANVYEIRPIRDHNYCVVTGNRAFEMDDIKYEMSPPSVRHSNIRSMRDHDYSAVADDCADFEMDEDDVKCEPYDYSAVVGDCGDYEMDGIKCESSPSSVRHSNVYGIRPMKYNYSTMDGECADFEMGGQDDVKLEIQTSVASLTYNSDDETFSSSNMHKTQPIHETRDDSENSAIDCEVLIDYDSDGAPHLATTSELRPNKETSEMDHEWQDVTEVSPQGEPDEENENNEFMQNLNSDTEGQNLNSDTRNQTAENSLSGRRIIDIKFFFKQIQDKPRDSGCCHFENMIFQTEVKKGLNSLFEFQCGVCGHKKNVWSCEDAVPVNVTEAAVMGIASVGLGAYHLNEFCSNMEIPCISDYMYDKTQKKQQKDWWELSKKEVNDALMEEIRLAQQDGKVDANGNALITVVADGSWPKRSYNKNFSSLSGCAVIIGMRTNKVIYYDVKDKYCHVCKIAQSNGKEPREHNCNTNYTGASSSMETTIIVEGFQYCETLGARFNEFVADGDSSTFKRISDMKIYQNPEVPVEKDECCNHLYRNFRKAFEALEKATKRFSVEARKHVTKKKANDICLGIQTAAKHWRGANVTTLEKLVNLEKDVLNAPMHVFGIHHDCDPYYCTKKTEPDAEKVVALLKDDGIFGEILSLCTHYFASSVPSMLLNYNNNMAESFNNLVAKYTGGKRINYCLAQSYRSRVARAVVQYNTEGCSGSTYHATKGSNAPQLRKMETIRKRKTRNNLLKKKAKPPKSRFSERQIDKGEEYGPDRQTLDMAPHIFDIEKKQFMDQLETDQKNRDHISAVTIHQHLNRKWRDMRKKYLTSYYFSQIINARNRNSYKNILEKIVYKDDELSNTAEHKHQKNYQQKALKCFGVLHGTEYISECGLIIDSEHCFLATSPYRLYGENGIIVIKCPPKAFKKSIQDAIEKKLIPLWKVVRGVETINKSSPWYIEIQGQLHITSKSFAYIVVWLESEFRVEKIYRDDDFWHGKMKEPLVFFYEQCMIKELVNPRKKRFMPLRAYNKETETFE